MNWDELQRLRDRAWEVMEEPIYVGPALAALKDFRDALDIMLNVTIKTIDALKEEE